MGCFAFVVHVVEEQMYGRKYCLECDQGLVMSGAVTYAVASVHNDVCSGCVGSVMLSCMLCIRLVITFSGMHLEGIGIVLSSC